jgi:dipeptidyl-peptidase-4
VGICGWSYGGYMSLMCLARASEIFKVAVAGAPVTHWEGYDTHYTERYMGTPQSNPTGYDAGSVLSHAEGITGKLMLVHGLIDENVHFRHTARLINALIKARKSYELLLFPDERHMPRSLADRIFMEEEIYTFLSTHLASPK